MALSPTLELFLSKLTLYLWVKLHRLNMMLEDKSEEVPSVCEYF